MKYIVHFELFGVKKRAKVEANSPEDARYKVSGAIMRKIVWGDIEAEPPSDNEVLNNLKDIFGL